MKSNVPEACEPFSETTAYLWLMQKDYFTVQYLPFSGLSRGPLLNSMSSSYEYRPVL